MMRTFRLSTMKPRISPSHTSSSDATLLNAIVFLRYDIDTIERFDPCLAHRQVGFQALSLEVDRGVRRLRHTRRRRLLQASRDVSHWLMVVHQNDQAQRVALEESIKRHQHQSRPYSAPAWRKEIS